MKNIFSLRNLRIVVIAFSVFGMFCFGKVIFYFFFPKQEVVVPIKMMEEFGRTLRMTNMNMKREIDIVEYAFLDKMDRDQMKTKPWYDMSDSVSQILSSLRESVNHFRYIKIEQNSGWKNKSQFDGSGNFEFEKGNHLSNSKRVTSYSQKELSELADKIKSSSDQLLAQCKYPDMKKDFKQILDQTILFNVETSYSDWISLNRTPEQLLTFVLNADRFISDCYAAEYMMKRRILGNIYTSDMRVDRFTPFVLANKNFIHLGEEYSSHIFLTTRSMLTTYDVIVGDKNSNAKKVNEWEFGITQVNPVLHEKKLKFENGAGKYTVTPTKTGKYQYYGALKTINPNGEFNYIPFEAEYEVIPKTQ